MFNYYFKLITTKKDKNLFILFFKLVFIFYLFFNNKLIFQF